MWPKRLHVHRIFLWAFVHLMGIYGVNGQIRILHYTETTGFDHKTREVSAQMFEELGDSLGFVLVDDETGVHFSSQASLDSFALVVFSNTSGDAGLTATERANFEAYIQQGGSYLGIHAASDTYRHSTANGGDKGSWDWYAETLSGCSVQQNPNHTSSNKNADMFLVGTEVILRQSLPDPWNKTEEYYYWENGYLNNDFVKLLEVESTGNQSYDAARMTAQYRVLPSGGKAFYTSLGHAASNYTSDESFKQLIKNALEWILVGNSTSIEENASSPKLYLRKDKKLVWTASFVKPSTLEVHVYSLDGKCVQTISQEVQSASDQLIEIRNDLPSGYYWVKLLLDGEEKAHSAIWWNQN
ncbi:MAG: ThuA domain-containing protein [Bacteroidota bacterium]